jgi:hypothetical protein
MLEESEAPIITCTVDLDSAWRDAVEARVHVLRRGLGLSQRPAFEEALAEVRRVLTEELAPESKGAAIFARAGTRPFVQAMQFRVPLPTRFVLDWTPHVYDLVELKDTYDRYLVLVASDDHARLVEVNLGAVTREMWTAHPGTRRRVGRDWGRALYQDHSPRRGEPFVAEMLAVLERFAAQTGHAHVVLAGSPRLTTRLRAAMPPALAEKLVDVVPTAGDAPTEDVVAATLSSFVEREEQDSLAVVSLLWDELKRQGLAVCGTEASLDALARGRADLLVIAHGYEPPLGWCCGACTSAGTGSPPAHCPACGHRRVREANLREVLVKAAERQGRHVEVVRHSELLMELGGVGCLLRFDVEPARLALGR